MAIAAVSMLGFVLLLKRPLKVSKGTFAKLFGIGLVVCAHWVTFYHSIKIANVSIALVSLSATALFTSFIEPIAYRKPIHLPDILSALCIILGIYLIFNFETRYAEGILYGLCSAFLAALFTVINSKQIKNRPAETICLYEMIGGFCGLSLFLLFSGGFEGFDFFISSSDWLWLLLLGTVCTAGAFVMGIAVMKNLSPYAVVLATNLEPVYGILFAWIIFGEKEHMTNGFYVGAGIVLLTVFTYPVIKRKLKIEN